MLKYFAFKQGHMKCVWRRVATSRERRAAWHPAAPASGPRLPKAAHTLKHIEVLPCHVPPPRRSTARRVPPVRPLPRPVRAHLPRPPPYYDRFFVDPLTTKQAWARLFKAAESLLRATAVPASLSSPPLKCRADCWALASRYSNATQPPGCRP
jgi:hypothetical protein